MSGRLQGKRALVTGAARGIGRAIALAFAEAGAYVLANDINAEALRETASLLNARGGEALCLAADISQEEQVRRMIGDVERHAGGLDILVNNAGVASASDTTITDTDAATWDAIMAVNLRGVYLCCKYAIPWMARNAGGGAIVNIASVVGYRAGRLVPTTVYTPAKGGVIALTKQLAVDYGRQNIRVNAICPGIIDTPMLHSVFSEAQIRERFLPQVPLNRLGTPEEVAQTALFLASDEASYLSGAVVVVDGGMTA